VLALLFALTTVQAVPVNPEAKPAAPEKPERDGAGKLPRIITDAKLVLAPFNTTRLAQMLGDAEKLAAGLNKTMIATERYVKLATKSPDPLARDQAQRQTHSRLAVLLDKLKKTWASFSPMKTSAVTGETKPTSLTTAVKEAATLPAAGTPESVIPAVKKTQQSMAETRTLVKMLSKGTGAKNPAPGAMSMP
jgi:hypothetical protein